MKFVTTDGSRFRHYGVLHSFRSMSLPGMNGKVLLTIRLRPAAVETRDGILLQDRAKYDVFISYKAAYDEATALLR